MSLEEIISYRPKSLITKEPTNKTRRPYIDVGEHLPKSANGYFEIVRISLRSSTGDVIIIRAKELKNGYKIDIVDEYDTEFIEYRNKYAKIPTQGEIFKIIENMNNEKDAQPYWLAIIEMNGFETLNDILEFIQIDSNLYPNLNTLLINYLKMYGYK